MEASKGVAIALGIGAVAYLALNKGSDAPVTTDAPRTSVDPNTIIRDPNSGSYGQPGYINPQLTAPPVIYDPYEQTPVGTAPTITEIITADELAIKEMRERVAALQGTPGTCLVNGSTRFYGDNTNWRHQSPTACFDFHAEMDSDNKWFVGDVMEPGPVTYQYDSGAVVEMDGPVSAVTSGEKGRKVNVATTIDFSGQEVEPWQIDAWRKGPGEKKTCKVRCYQGCPDASLMGNQEIYDHGEELTKAECMEKAQFKMTQFHCWSNCTDSGTSNMGVHWGGAELVPPNRY